MLKLPVANGKIQGEWRWETFDDNVRFEIYVPTSDQLLRYHSRFAIGSEKPKTQQQFQFVAKNWFRNFEGIGDADGHPLENSVENRLAILRYRDTGLFILARINASSEEEIAEDFGFASD